MRKIEFLMGMPIIIEIVDGNNFDEVFRYFGEIDERFSPYKQNSEVTKINDGSLKLKFVGKEMKLILKMSQELKKDTDGYFDVFYKGNFNPSGIVKGWAIYTSSQILKNSGCKHFYINAGGDIQTMGLNSEGKKWAIGIRNPFNIHENVKVVYLSGEGIATSGTYEKGEHIYDPLNKTNRKKLLARGPHKGVATRNFSDDFSDIVSLTVIGNDVFEADKYSTPAFAMGREGINFIERQKGLEGYMIDKKGIATMTSGFEKYLNA